MQYPAKRPKTHNHLLYIHHENLKNEFKSFTTHVDTSTEIPQLLMTILNNDSA